MRDSLHVIQSIFLDYGYYTLFGGLLLESIFFTGMFVPGTIILVLGGFFSAKGDLSIPITIAVSFIGTVIGDNISYFIGRLDIYDSKMLKKYKDKVTFNNLNIRWYTIFFQFTSITRMLLPFYLGINKYKVSKWLMLNVVATVIFIAGFWGSGYLGYAVWRVAVSSVKLSDYVQYVFNFLLIVMLLKYIYKTKVNRLASVKR